MHIGKFIFPLKVEYLKRFAAHMWTQSEITDSKYGYPDKKQWKIAYEFVFGTNDDPPAQGDQGIDEKI